MKTAEIQRFVLIVKNARPEEDDTFAWIVENGARLLKLSDEQIANEFSCSRPTVGRWRNGVSAPHPALRPAIYAWLLKRARLAYNN